MQVVVSKQLDALDKELEISKKKFFFIFLIDFLSHILEGSKHLLSQ